MNEHDGNAPPEDIDSVLRQGLKQPLPDTEAMQRLYQRSAAEWRRTTAVEESRLRFRPLTWGLAAAAALLLGIGIAWMALPVTSSAPFGIVTRIEDSGGQVTSGYWHHHALGRGTVLRVGEVVVSHAPALITLPAGGTLRVAADTELAVEAPTTARLRRGLVYVDLPSGTGEPQPFRLITRLGSVEHLGTQFEVLSNDQSVRIRVREGRIRFHSGSQDAVAGAGTQLQSTTMGSLVRTDIVTYGREWLWVAALAPDYEIEGKPLMGFLQWAGRELGRPVQFSDGRAREVADRTILHGSVKGREPLDALAIVLSTTSLRYELRDGAIWIESGRGI